MRSSWKQAAIAIVCSVFVFSGCTLVTTGADPKPELLKPVKLPVDFLEVKKGTIANELRGTGVIVSRTTTYAQFVIDGKTGQLYAKPGDRVQKGDLLMVLDPGTLQLDQLNESVKLEEAKAALEAAKASGNEDSIKLAAMSVDVEQLRLSGLQRKMENTKLTAPLDGIVDFVEPGLAPNVDVTAYRPLFGIIDSHDVQVKYMMTSASGGLSNVEVGMPVSLSYKGRTLKGVVTQTPQTAPLSLNSSVADKNARTLLIDFDHIPDDAVFGDNIDIELVINQKENVIKIPRVALRSYQGRDFVHIMDGETRKEIDVEKGLVSPTEVEITKGLKEGMKVVLNN